MPSKLSKLRKKAFDRQGGRCYYCSSPMALDDLEEFAARLGITSKAAERFKCTAEHLRAVQDGGKDTTANIVAACLVCNATRHKIKNPPSHKDYKRHVASRIRRGKWHPAFWHRHFRLGGSIARF